MTENDRHKSQNVGTSSEKKFITQSTKKVSHSINSPTPSTEKQYIYRKGLIPPHDLKVIFNDLRNHLAGSFKGTTRDERLAEQLIFILFCKIMDEQDTEPDQHVLLQINHPNKANILERLLDKFNHLKTTFSSVFDQTDTIDIDLASLIFIFNKIQYYCISDASRDSIGDAFEVFLGSSLRGNKGQFFTPKNVVRTMIEFLDPKVGETLLDPACGSGGFLTETFLYILTNNPTLDSSLLIESLSNTLFGIDKDCFLAKVARIYLMILGLLTNNIFCDNSLESPINWDSPTKKLIKLNYFDIVITNPPFGSKISISDNKLLREYELGHKWVKTKSSMLKKSSKLQDQQPPQILFIERCLQLLKPGGRMGLVLPDGIFGNPSDRYILEFLYKNTKLLGIISCSTLVFLPNAHIKTSLLFIEKSSPPPNYEFFMAIANNIGHDKNGKPLYLMDTSGDHIEDFKGNKILNDDFSTIITNFRNFLKGIRDDHTHLGFSFNFSQIQNNILIPEYYNPEIDIEISKLENTGKFSFIAVKELVKKGFLDITRGHEVGSRFYGTGNVPFVRTSDLINWEINIDPKKQVNEDIYYQYKDKQDIQPGDILFISDGTFLIGKSAMVTENDTKILIQSHLKKLRVVKNDLLDEFILLWALNSEIVQKQIKAKTFVQSTISTLGNRLLEIKLPIPKESSLKKILSSEIKEIITTKMILKDRIRSSVDFLDKFYS